MKRLFLIFLVLFISGFSFSQYFQNFDSLNFGDYIGVKDASWTTWSGTTGGNEDAKIDTMKAYSLNNSLYFNSTDPNGGPQDVLLEFGKAYNSGTFEFEHAMYVSKNKGAYFNFQGETKAGNVWALDCQFVDDEKLLLTDGGVLLVEISYPAEKWFILKFVIDLSTNNWEIFLDGVSQGKFQNSVNQIASIDYYPNNSAANGGNGLSEFWIDDVGFSHIPYILPNRNAALLSVDFEQVEIAGVLNTPNVEIRNLGQQTITSFDVEVEYNGNKISESITGVSIDSFETYLLKFDKGFVIDQSATNIMATVSNVNGIPADDNINDDSKTNAINPIIPSPGRVVIVEEATGTWCGWCPRGAVALEYLARDYHGLAQGIAVHNRDGMTNTVYDKGINTLISGYPSAVVNRGADIDPGNIWTSVNESVTTPPIAVLKNGAKYDASTKMLDVSITVDFTGSANSNWKLACVIIEDSVTGYEQSNYYSGGGNGSLIGPDGIDWADLPSTVPASQMVYNHVARAISPGFEGFEESFPTTVSSGEKHTVNFDFEINPAWNIDKMHVVGILIKPNGQVENGSTSTIDKAITNGFVNGVQVVSTKNLAGPDLYLELFPNPVSGTLHISSSAIIENIRIFDVNGKLVISEDVNDKSLDRDVTTLENGIYFSRIITQEGEAIRKFVVQK